MDGLYTELLWDLEKYFFRSFRQVVATPQRVFMAED